MLLRALAFSAFAAIFAYFGFFALTGFAALLAKLLFAFFVALLAGAAVLTGAHSCERRELAEQARRIDL